MKNVSVEMGRALQNRQDYIINMAMVQRLCVELLNYSISHNICHWSFEMAHSWWALYLAKHMHIHTHTTHEKHDIRILGRDPS